MPWLLKNNICHFWPFIVIIFWRVQGQLNKYLPFFEFLLKKNYKLLLGDKSMWGEKKAMMPFATSRAEIIIKWIRKGIKGRVLHRKKEVTILYSVERLLLLAGNSLSLILSDARAIPAILNFFLHIYMNLTLCPAKPVNVCDAKTWTLSLVPFSSCSNSQ